MFRPPRPAEVGDLPVSSAGYLGSLGLTEGDDGNSEMEPLRSAGMKNLLSRAVAHCVTSLVAAGIFGIHAAFAGDLAVLVECDTGFLVGGCAGGKWQDSVRAGKALAAGAKLRVFSTTAQVGEATAGKAAPEADVCPDVFVVPLTPKPKRENLYAIAAPWNPLPRAPRLAGTTQEAYVKSVREILVARGIREPKVKVTQIVRVDLDGDGEDEALISATNYHAAENDEVPSSAPQGSYSFVLLRWLVDGKVRSRVLEGEFYPKKATFNAPNRYRVGGVYDLDGDGRMEVVVESAYYEGGATTVYRCTPAKIEKVLEIACGV
jgi:hypothetical protein